MTTRPILHMPAPQVISLNGPELPVLVRGLTRQTTKAFRSAWLKGFHAALAGKSRNDNPYASDSRNDRGGVTWARAYLRDWGQGFKDGTQHLEGN